MEQFSQPAQNEELLNQSVSDAELKEILERIGHDEFNGNPQPTIRDIVEGTSADPETIGRILGDIRKEDWEQRFGFKLKDHEERIESIETKQKGPAQAPTVIHHYHEVPVQPATTIKPNSYNGSAKTQYGYGSKVNKPDTSVTNIIVGVFFLCFVAIMISVIVSENKKHQEFDKEFRQMGTGFPYPSFNNGSGVNIPTNGPRPFTAKEVEEMLKHKRTQPRATLKSPNGDPFPFPYNEADLNGLRKK